VNGKEESGRGIRKTKLVEMEKGDKGRASVEVPTLSLQEKRPPPFEAQGKRSAAATTA
jgi:hypothetical protein